MFKLATCVSLLLIMGCAGPQMHRQFNTKWSDGVRNDVLICHTKFKEEYFECLIARGAMI